MPLLAMATPPLVDPVFGDFHGVRGWQLDELTTTRHCYPSELLLAIWTGLDEMLLDLGWPLSFARFIVLRLALLARLVLLLLFHLRFDECCRLFLLLFQLLYLLESPI